MALKGKRPLDLTLAHGPEMSRLLLGYGALPRHEIHESMLAVDDELRRRGQLARQQRAVRREWGWEAVRQATRALERGDLSASGTSLHEAWRLLGDDTQVVRVQRQLDDLARLSRLQAEQVVAECRRRLRLDPGNRIWLQPMLTQTPCEQYPVLLNLEELAGLLQSVGMRQELPRPADLPEALDDLPDYCLAYLGRRLAG